MAIASKINIEVDSAAFRAFQEKFDKYKAALDETPAAWCGVGSEVARTKTGFEAVANSIATQAGNMALISKHSTDFYHVTTATARHWHDLALSTKNVAANIFSATESLLKWSGVISLLTGGAGLFGFDRLAHSVSGQRQAAMGTGGDYGARAAFLTNFRRLGDPEGILGRVAEAQANVKESVPLRILGLTKEDLKGDPTDVAIKALRSAGRIARQDKISGLQVGSDPHLQLFSGPERIRLRDLPEKELEELVAKMRADQKNGRMNLSPADQKGYQEFTTQMERASRQVETTFVKGLVKLESPLEKLSKATTKLVAKFMVKDGPIDHLLTDLSHSLDWLAGEIDKPEFEKKVVGFIQNIGSLAGSLGSMVSGLAKFARWLGVSEKGIGATPDPGGGGTTGKGYGTHGTANNVTTGPASNRGSSPIWRGTGAITGGATSGANAGASAGESADVVAFIRKEAIAKGIDPDVAVAVARTEGLKGLDPKMGHWSTGSNDAGTSFGPFQMHYASNIPGFRARGLGDDFTRDTYRDARKMEDWKAAVDYALDHAKKEHSWRAWHGFNRHPASEGLDYRPPAPAAAKQKVSVNSVPGGNTSLSSGAAAAGSA